MADCTECRKSARWEISWSPTMLAVHSCEEHLAGMCGTYAVRRLRERPQDGTPYLFLTDLSLT
jgi:hypothetical protein